MGISIYGIERAFSHLESQQEGFISLKSLFEKEDNLVYFLSASEDAISEIREEALKEINDAKVDRNRYRHLAKERISKDKRDNIKNRQRYNEQILLCNKLYQETHNDFYFKEIEYYQNQISKLKISRDSFYLEWAKEKSEKIAYYKRIASICYDLETFKSVVKTEIKANRAEIKKQLDF